MLAPVIVDLPPDVSARAAQVVLDACNDAIANGVCLSEAAADDQPPRALAVARAADRRVLVVRIEVRLHPDTVGSTIVRELEFARRDPLLERWRSVGLAIATIVGEGEQRAREERERLPPPAEPQPPAEPARPAEPVPSRERPSGTEPARLVEPGRPAQPARAAEPARPAEAVRSAEPVATAHLEPPGLDPGSDVDVEPGTDGAPFEHRPFFVGLGALTGTGFGTGAWRAGGTLRAGWHGIDGWQLASSLAVAWRTSEETFTAAWMSLEAGAGYRLAPSDAVSVGALVFGGVERARYEVLAAGVSHAETRYGPRFGLGVDAHWRASDGFGAWISAEGSSSGRESRLFVAPDRAPIGSYPIDLALFLGVAWWPD
jgi:hypothetical protein